MSQWETSGSPRPGVLPWRGAWAVATLEPREWNSRRAPANLQSSLQGTRRIQYDPFPATRDTSATP
eukprot:scaffold82943_cov49-Phaeocystis_antarctica.AAC.2